MEGNRINLDLEIGWVARLTLPSGFQNPTDSSREDLLQDGPCWLAKPRLALRSSLSRALFRSWSEQTSKLYRSWWCRGDIFHSVASSNTNTTLLLGLRAESIMKSSERNIVNLSTSPERRRTPLIGQETAAETNNDKITAQAGSQLRLLVSRLHLSMDLVDSRLVHLRNLRADFCPLVIVGCFSNSESPWI